jgi:molybdate transport system substrate-binding protein
MGCDMRKICTLLLAIVAAAAPMRWTCSHAAAVEIHVLTAGAVQEAEKQLAAQYRRMTGNRVTFVAGTVGQIELRLKNREAADVIVVSKPALDQLSQAGEIRPGASAVLGRVGIGVGVKEGQPAPDISTTDKFRAAMLNARSITYMDPAAGASSGIATAKILKELGIADQMAGKTRLTESGYSADRVASGEVEMAIQNISEIVPVKGVQLAGPLPPPLQVYTVYAAGVASNSVNPKEAMDVIRFLIRPESARTWQDAGIEPAFQKRPETGAKP